MTHRRLPRHPLKRAVRVRLARHADAAILAKMANDLNDYVGIRSRPFTRERVMADGFGPKAAFTPLVAEVDRVVVGYAFVSLGYNTDAAAREVWLHDLFVVPGARGLGVGSALMKAVAARTLRLGASSLAWGVHTANTGALEFYRRLGSVDSKARIMAISGKRLRALTATTR